jgi:tripartite-type tricarboxylate transporter receptor subunit TctC
MRSDGNAGRPNAFRLWANAYRSLESQMKGNWTCYMLAWLLAVASVAGADAQTGLYPNKPVQIIADSSAGSTPDVALRFVAEGLTQVRKQQVLVNNHPGAGGSLAVRLAAAAAPDGYTLYQPVLSTFVSLRPAAPNIPIHVPQDFLPIGFVAENPMFIAVSPSLGISTLPELIARAKKAPDEITYATTGVGRLTHLTGELLQREAGIKLLLVPYTGGPSHAVTDVATGRVAMMIEGYSGVAGAARSGSIKLIAVASAKRLAEFPDVPTVAETIPGFQATGWAVLVAPIGTPEAIIDKISEDLRKVTLDPELQTKLAPLGSYTNPMSAAEATAFVHKQQQTWQPILDEIAKNQR